MVLYILGGLALAVVFGFLFGALVMWLWNALMPALFGLKMITYWQGVGLVILARLLVGSFGHHKCQAHARNAEQHKSDWSAYDAWWQEEGNAAFDAYLQRKRAGAAE